MMIVGVFLHRKRMGLINGRCSKMYSSVAKLNMMLLDSANKISTCPGSDERKDGKGSVNIDFRSVENFRYNLCRIQSPETCTPFLIFDGSEQFFIKILESICGD